MNPDRLEGSFVALITPMTEDGMVDSEALVRLTARQLRAGTAGIVAAGTTGESASLDAGEYAQLLSRVCAEVDGRIPVVAGVGGASTAHVLELAKSAGSCGVDALLAVTPYYLRTTQEGLYGHFAALADAVSLPIVLYNVPSRTGNDLLPATVARLLGKENIVAIKEAVADESRIRELVAVAGDALRVLSGDDETCLRSMLAGAKGVVSVTANLAPSAMRRLTELARRGAVGEARALDLRLQALHRTMMREPNPIPVKHALHHLGLAAGGIRLPLVKPSPRLAAEIEQMLAGDVGELIDA